MKGQRQGQKPQKKLGKREWLGAHILDKELVIQRLLEAGGFPGDLRG
jgi:hypothetical protein